MKEERRIPRPTYWEWSGVSGEEVRTFVADAGLGGWVMYMWVVVLVVVVVVRYISTVSPFGLVR